MDKFRHVRNSKCLLARRKGNLESLLDDCLGDAPEELHSDLFESIFRDESEDGSGYFDDDCCDYQYVVVEWGVLLDWYVHEDVVEQDAEDNAAAVRQEH